MKCLSSRGKGSGQVVFPSLFINTQYEPGLTCSSSLQFSYLVKWPQLAKGPQNKILIKLQPDGLHRYQTILQSFRTIQTEQDKTRENAPQVVVPVLLGPDRQKLLFAGPGVISGFLCFPPPDSLHSSTPSTFLYRLPLKGLNEGNLVSRGRKCTRWLTCLWWRFRDASWCHVEWHMPSQA